MIGLKFIHFLTLLSVLLISCKKPNEKRYSFSNPLDTCRPYQDTAFTKTIYDPLNKLSFKIGSQWRITFNKSQNVTGGIDTVASDRLAQIRTFTINSTLSKLSLRDFFIEEIGFMEKDSTVNILSLGEYSIDSQTSLYVITKMIDHFSVKNVFFYTKLNDRIVIIQLSINEDDPNEKFCELIGIINSISFKVYLAPAEASIHLK